MFECQKVEDQIVMNKIKINSYMYPIELVTMFD